MARRDHRSSSARNQRLVVDRNANRALGSWCKMAVPLSDTQLVVQINGLPGNRSRAAAAGEAGIRIALRPARTVSRALRRNAPAGS